MAYSEAIYQDVKRVFESYLHGDYVRRNGATYEAGFASTFMSDHCNDCEDWDEWTAQWDAYASDNSDYWATELRKHAGADGY